MSRRLPVSLLCLLAVSRIVFEQYESLPIDCVKDQTHLKSFVVTIYSGQTSLGRYLDKMCCPTVRDTGEYQEWSMCHFA
jgi:hypothetical protein